MKLPGLILLLALLLATSMTGQGDKPENFNNYDALTLQFRLNSAITLTPTKTTNDINLLKSSLSFFPRSDYRQTPLTLRPHATPDATIQTTPTNTIYTWTEPPLERLAYGIDATIKTTNTFLPVKTTIPFPIRSLNTSLLPYTQPTPFIDITPAIEERARTIAGTSNDLYDVVYQIANWNKNNIKYDLSTLTADAVQKSSWVLENKQGVCDELTNLFISMLRSLGIPARFVSGMVYSNIDYQWGPHGWAEVYFPDYGWIPFDVTFGQYGWISPSHLKLKDDTDSGTPSAEYTWQANGVNVDITPITLDTTLIRTGTPITPPITLSVKPYRTNVGPGSNVPLLITVENTLDAYVSTSIIIRKGPELTEKNTKEILLKPRETTIVPWIMTTPQTLTPNYVYTSTIEAASSFNGHATTTITYASDYPIMTLAEAERIVNTYAQRDDKHAFTTITFQCTSDQEMYYHGDTAQITCTTTNTATTPITANICVNEACHTATIHLRTPQEEQFTISAEHGGRLLATIENDDFVSYAPIDLHVITVPDVRITDITPTTVDYDDDVTLTFTITADTTVHNLTLDFNFDTMTLDTFTGSRIISIDTRGRSLLNGLPVTVRFADEKRKTYETQQDITVTVENMPWYARLIQWTRSIF